MPSEVGGNSHLSFQNYDAVQSKEALAQQSKGPEDIAKNDYNQRISPKTNNNNVNGKVNQDLRSI